MLIVNANGVGLGGGPNQASIIFPAGQTTSVMFAFRVPMHTMSNLRGVFDAWLYGNGSAISAFSAQYTIINAPEPGGAIAISNSPVSLSLTQPSSNGHGPCLQHAECGIRTARQQCDGVLKTHRDQPRPRALLWQLPVYDCSKTKEREGCNGKTSSGVAERQLS